MVALQQLTDVGFLNLQTKGTHPYSTESDSTHDGDFVDDLDDGYNYSD